MQELLGKLGIKDVNYGATTGGSNSWITTKGKELVSYSPIDGKPIAKIIQATSEDYETIVKKAQEAFKKWRMIPAPQRGQVIREIGERLREFKDPLGELITLEMGKIKEEGLGEVQEMIDIADFALGISRQLYGLTIASERPNHRMMEQWQPLGLVGLITAFNFPAAVWSWNSLLASTCGDSIIWKPSSKTPLTAIGIQNVIAPVIDKYDIDGIFNLIIGSGREVGNQMVQDKRVPLISATGSCRMGSQIGMEVGKRLGKSLLELGGNNGIIVTENCNLEMAIKATLFGAVGTAGQRCTSTRRIIIHKSIKEKFVNILVDSYSKVKIGNPLEKGTLMGPLIDKNAVKEMLDAVEKAKKEGGKVLYGGNCHTVEGLEGGFYVQPTIIEAKNEYEIVQEETFAPILYIIEYENIEEALKLHNDVPQGLSSAIFTDSIHYGEMFLSPMGSDCGLANINIGTSGAEIGGAFGGEKDTGGGRESGSDAWKVYMRRQTNTINWGKEMPLAQGIDFNIN